VQSVPYQRNYGSVRAFPSVARQRLRKHNFKIKFQILADTPPILTEIVHFFPQSLQTSTWIVPRLGHERLLNNFKSLCYQTWLYPTCWQRPTLILHALPNNTGPHPTFCSHRLLNDVHLFRETSSISDSVVKERNVCICFAFHCKVRNTVAYLLKARTVEAEKLPLLGNDAYSRCYEAIR
jgi:hypothetical protein